MTSLNVLVVEDEILIAETIKMYLKERGHEVVGMAISYEEAVVAYHEYQPDLILLDIRLYGSKSGFDFANYLNSIDSKTPFIYLTSQYDKKSLDIAMATQPNGYLSKPIQKESLWTTIEFANHHHRTNNVEKQRILKIQNGNTTLHLEEQKINYIEADHIYARIRLDDDSEVITRITLSQIINDLKSEHFIQCHRSFLINLKKVTSYSNSELTIKSKKIPISRSRKQEVFSKLTEYL